MYAMRVIQMYSLPLPDVRAPREAGSTHIEMLMWFKVTGINDISKSHKIIIIIIIIITTTTITINVIINNSSLKSNFHLVSQQLNVTQRMLLFNNDFGVQLQGLPDVKYVHKTVPAPQLVMNVNEHVQMCILQ